MDVMYSTCPIAVLKAVAVKPRTHAETPLSLKQTAKPAPEKAEAEAEAERNRLQLLAGTTLASLGRLLGKEV